MTGPGLEGCFAQRRSPRRRGRGLTLIELVVAFGIVALVAAVAVPSLRWFTMQQRLKATASELLNDIQSARAEAFRRTEDVVIVAVRSNASTTCYGTVRAAPDTLDCDCSRTADLFCRQYGVTVPTFKMVSVPRSTGVTLAAAADLWFNPFNGMIYDRTAKTLTVTASPGGQLQLNVSATGLARICVPSGSSVSGFMACV
jgi:type II secretory pathway pseudopilin PulG